MTTTYQVSGKFGDTIVLVKVEDASPALAYQDLALSLSEFGQEQAEAVLKTFEHVLSVDPSRYATAAVTQAIPAQVVQAPAPEQWGNPPVPPMQSAPTQQIPAQQYQQQPPAAPAAATPVCQHGPKKLVRGNGARGPWVAWGCIAGKQDPTKCNPGLDFDAARGL